MRTPVDDHPVSSRFLCLVHGINSRRVSQIARQLGIGFRIMGCRNRLFTPADVEEFAEARRKTKRYRPRKGSAKRTALPRRSLPVDPGADYPPEFRSSFWDD